MSTVISILGALLILSVLVFVHEGGHFLAAKLTGVCVEEFALGMGPAIWKREHKGTLYALRAFPIGGFCKFHNEDAEVQDELSFGAQKLWKRFLIVAAGPFMNIVFAVIFAIIALLAYGDFAAQVVEFTSENSPAQEAGLLPGDMLYAVDGKKIEYYSEAADMIKAADSDRVVITVERDGEKLDYTLTDIFNQEEGRNMIGIMMQPVRRQYAFFEAIGSSVTYVGSVIGEMFDFLGGLFTKGVQQGDITGPVGTISLIGSAVRMGFETVLRLTVLISVNLGIINILPLPALDGGRLVFMVVEGIRGKPVPPEKEGMVHFVGIVLLLALMVFLSIQDVMGLIGG